MNQLRRIFTRWNFFATLIAWGVIFVSAVLLEEGMVFWSTAGGTALLVLILTTLSWFFVYRVPLRLSGMHQVTDLNVADMAQLQIWPGLPVVIFYYMAVLAIVLGSIESIFIGVIYSVHASYKLLSAV